MAEESGQERTEEATPKRLREARDRGSIPRSRELNTFIMLMAGAVGLLMFGEGMAAGMAEVMSRTFQLSREDIQNTNSLLIIFEKSIYYALVFTSPFLAVCLIAAFIGPIGLGGWSFSSHAMSFSWEKINPIAGIKRIFGWQGLMELIKALIKFFIILMASVLVIWNISDDLLRLGLEPIQSGLAHAASLTARSFLLISSVLIVVVISDVPFQLWHFFSQLKMSRQEIRDEYKDTEGKPEVKGRIRRLQMQFAKRRMMSEVPKADVIITNPTHYAVALCYDQNRMKAPILVAKGADLVAAEIRRIASEAQIPMLSAPPLARALYFSTELNQQIPAGLYTAVAKVLAYVYQLKKVGTKHAKKIDLSDLPIPDELQKNA